MTDTNSKAQVTDAMVMAAAKTQYELHHLTRWEAAWDDARERHLYDARHVLSAALAAQEKPEPGVAVAWESAEEWEIELKAFHAAGRKDVPADVQDLIQKLWSMYCDAAAPSPDLPEGEVK